MNTPAQAAPLAPPSSLHGLVMRIVTLLSGIPESFIALLGRFSIAAVFWKSGQTKIEGFAVDLIAGDVQLGWPRLAESALALFESEYRLPFLPPELAAPMAALGEHVFPLLILLGQVPLVLGAAPGADLDLAAWAAAISTGYQRP